MFPRAWVHVSIRAWVQYVFNTWFNTCMGSIRAWVHVSIRLSETCATTSRSTLEMYPPLTPLPQQAAMVPPAARRARDHTTPPQAVPSLVVRILAPFLPPFCWVVSCCKKRISSLLMIVRRNVGFVWNWELRTPFASFCCFFSIAFFFLLELSTIKS